MNFRCSRSELVLASASPRRRALLESLIQGFGIEPADIDEAVRADEPPARYVARMSNEKAAAVAIRHPQSMILASDTAVIVDERILGKPCHAAEAAEMLRLLSGRRHQVFSAVTLRSSAAQSNTRLSITTVEFAVLPASWIGDYVASGEPMDKAGAYAVQGAAAAWIRRIEGSYSGVVGLPLFETAELLREAGLVDPAGEPSISESGRQTVANTYSKLRTAPDER
ncbi:MAG: hypothetical protein CVV18_03745 [Gammaproteobacteria bacterium HGW-Gammaproteobacteria-8]|nr:MAG: hypothetical protein CVV18_03745 [Gammaproteobacteria bacterium HGW-Gammaproteobacteria-8]